MAVDPLPVQRHDNAPGVTRRVSNSTDRTRTCSARSGRTPITAATGRGSWRSRAGPGGGVRWHGRSVGRDIAACTLVGSSVRAAVNSTRSETGAPSGDVLSEFVSLSGDHHRVSGAGSGDRRPDRLPPVTDLQHLGARRRAAPHRSLGAGEDLRAILGRFFGSGLSSVTIAGQRGPPPQHPSPVASCLTVAADATTTMSRPASPSRIASSTRRGRPACVRSRRRPEPCPASTRSIRPGTTTPVRPSAACCTSRRDRRYRPSPTQR